MKLPDGTTLMHDATHAYDSAKAHEYYMRTRKLKGRKGGVKLDTGRDRMPKVKGLPHPKQKEKKPRTPEQQLSDIKRKLDLLQRQSGAKSGDVQKREATDKANAAKKVAATRRQAAEEVVAARKELAGLTESYQDPTLSGTEKATLKDKISAAKGKLAVAVEKARSLNESKKT